MDHPPMHESLAALLGAFASKGNARARTGRVSGAPMSAPTSAASSGPTEREQLTMLSSFGFSIPAELLS
jgi:hypothetical protein